ncbi:unnamed protein product [Ixodes pacificus]
MLFRFFWCGIAEADLFEHKEVSQSLILFIRWVLLQVCDVKKMYSSQGRDTNGREHTKPYIPVVDCHSLYIGCSIVPILS